MFRYRRYRVFLAFTVIAIFALYKFSASDAPWPSIESVRPGRSGSTASKEDGEARVEWESNPQVAQDSNRLDIDIPAAKIPLATQTPPPSIPPVDRPADKIASTSSSMVPAVIQSDWGMAPTPVPIPIIHWSKPSQHFPIATESLIKLPTSKPKPIPKIQFQFTKESAAEKVDREQKASAIQGVFMRSWNGYKQHAWLHDELMPTTGGFKDPFAGWGATLVDALDTLWIMGLKDEFDQAAKAVDKIDFTTTHRADIPLFETTIRYLGGLLGAYDISGQTYKNLLVKAEELAEVLISAFDTPNRMPETYYYWRPDFTANSHRASNRAILAEIGSLSMEFTRLSQLTGNDKYYDAIARITDSLEEFQGKTRLPGMWPTYIDVSGCKRIDYSATTYNKPLQNPIPVAKGSSKSPSSSIPPMKGEKVPASRPLSEDPSWAIDPDVPMEIGKPQEDPRADKTAPMVKPASPGSPTVPGEKLSPGGNRYVPLELPSPLMLEADPLKAAKKSSRIERRQMGPHDPAGVPTRITPTPALTIGEVLTAPPLPSRPVCEEIGFGSPSEHSEEEFTIGGMSDSTYEYLPKEWLLMGGTEPKYQKMYEAAVETMKKNLIFHPMLPDNADILVAGKMHIPSTLSTYGSLGPTMEPQQEHLTCFAGGMFGMGAKIFGRPQDMDLAKKITEGCIWSYNMTATGIMPEGFALLPCNNGKGKAMDACEWNVTAYYEALDPYAEYRARNYKDAMKTFQEQTAIVQQEYATELKEWQAQQKAAASPAAVLKAAVPPPVKDGLGVGIEAPTVTPLPGSAAAGAYSVPNNNFKKRQLGGIEADSLPAYSEQGAQAFSPTKVTLVEEEVPSADAMPSPVLRSVYSPAPALSHEEYVLARIEEEKLPIGVTKIGQRYYILRPEAIESVWYMYRITGDKYYREVGWKMFEAITTATTDIFGNSAIDDVTSANPVLKNSMESFWLAETLKYFYLLFSEENVISLDDWVLNTEAHPFKRPA